MLGGPVKVDTQVSSEEIHWHWLAWQWDVCTDVLTPAALSFAQSSDHSSDSHL